MNAISVTLTGSFENEYGSIPGFAHVDPSLESQFVNRTNWPSDGHRCVLNLDESLTPNLLSVGRCNYRDTRICWAIQILVNKQVNGKEGFLPTDKQIQFEVPECGTFILFFHQDEESVGWQLIRKVK